MIVSELPLNVFCKNIYQINGNTSWLRMWHHGIKTWVSWHPHFHVNGVYKEQCAPASLTHTLFHSYDVKVCIFWASFVINLVQCIFCVNVCKIVYKNNPTRKLKKLRVGLNDLMLLTFLRQEMEKVWNFLLIPCMLPVHYALKEVVLNWLY